MGIGKAPACYLDSTLPEPHLPVFTPSLEGQPILAEYNPFLPASLHAGGKVISCLALSISVMQFRSSRSVKEGDKGDKGESR